MAELHELSALEQGAAVRSGEVGVVELVEHHLARIARLNPESHAFLTVTVEQARAAARAFAGSEFEQASPLAGVPTAIKDQLGVPGTPTTFGSAAFRDHRPEIESAGTALLRRGGLISLGKTNLPEFAAGLYTDNDLTGSVRSPWDRTRTAGGSSGGAAVAVATGLVPVAHGTDGGGSIRIPSSACGLFGLKASRGRVSNGPNGIDVTGLSCHGPLARTVRDAAAFLDVLAIPQTGDPYRAQQLPPGQTYLAAADAEPGRLRIGAYATGAGPEAARAYREAIDLLVGLGHDVIEIENPAEPAVAEAFAVVWSIQQLHHQVPPEREELLRPISRWWREFGRQVTGERLFAALATLQLGGRRALTAFAPYDAILTPTLAQLPPSPDWFTAPDDRLVELARQGEVSPYAGLFNVTGQPAASLPLHWTEDGFPVGVTLAGRPAGEAQLLSLSAQLEAARPWAHRRPPVPADV
ncbi:amidase [Nocardia stercoris]|uniref:amidase n=1 Tax=Nocardia stercoris TaxID=2483361 RepID=A0A3M2L6L9_9NOCA|nr:amidase [Nocardia stercoris]RMI32984.1 amidase [Nocardia stercoris]